MIDIALAVLFVIAAVCTSAAGFLGLGIPGGLAVIGLWAIAALVVLSRGKQHKAGGPGGWPGG